MIVSKGFRPVGLAAAAVVSVLAASAQSASAQDKFNMGVTLDGLKLSKQLLGPTISERDLKGRVVLVEYWGVNCPPCLASIPHLATWYKELSPSGLVIVGAHAQGGPEDNIIAKAKSCIAKAGEKGAEYPVFTDGVTIPGGNDFSGIPHCFLFDHNGKCLFRGSPFEVEKLMREAVTAAPAAILGGRKLTKLAKLGDSLKNGGLPGPALKAAAAQTGSKDTVTAEEAAYIVERLNADASGRLEDAAKKRETNAFAAFSAYEKVAREYAGTEHAKAANDALAEMKKDKAVMADVKAWQQVEQIRKLEGGLSPKTGAGATNEWKQSNAAALNQMLIIIKNLKKSAPESKATLEALTIGLKHGLDKV
jgi:thiol-disulfide isomerase/thioredoxin